MSIDTIKYDSTSKNDLFFNCKITSTGPGSYIGSFNESKVTIRDELLLPERMKTIIYDEIDNSKLKKIGPWDIENDGRGISSNDATSSMIFNFKGTIAYLIGSYAADLGSVKVTVDNKTSQTIDLKNPNYAKTIIFAGETLDNKVITIKVEVFGNKKVVIYVIYYLDNGGFGMYELRDTKYDVTKEGTLNVTITRISFNGGGQSSVVVDTVDDTAISGKHYRGFQSTLDFPHGTLSKTIEIKTY